MAARAIEVADTVVDVLIEHNPPGETPETTIERLTVSKLRNKDYLSSVKGRKIVVFCGPYAQADTATRGQDRSEYLVTVFAFSRYTEQGPATDEWVDNEIAWVESNIFDLLGNARAERFPSRLADLGLWPEVAEVTLLYDEDLLDEQNLFASAVAFAYRRDETN